MATPPVPGTLVTRLTEALGPESVKISPEDLRVYGFDASYEGEAPWVAVFPTDARAVSAVVRIAADFDAAIVPRGAGTGLCGACVPVGGAVLVSFARMNRLLHLDTLNRRARVQPGLINLDLSRAARPLGLFYAPDPSSQATCTLGGNVATNAGGPHCLSYGTTVNHVLGLEFVDHRGEIVRTEVDDAGYDLTGALVGSEGTLGMVTAIDVRLLRLPPAVRVALASFADIESASAAVSAIIAAAIVPTALEIMDALVVHAVEAHYHAGFPSDAGAVLLVEVAGAAEDVEAREAQLATIVREHGALSWRTARDEAERQALWASRKGAAGALGRVAPNYYIQDATVPRTKLPQAVHAANAIARDHGIKVGNVFHAGDGNLHPLLTFDRRIKREVEAVVHAGTEILKACIALGGTISGEHGIGYEKRDSLGLVFSAEDLAAMARVRDVFDPRRLFNPEKIFPSGSRCGEVRPGVLAGAAPTGAWL